VDDDQRADRTSDQGEDADEEQQRAGDRVPEGLRRRGRPLRDRVGGRSEGAAEVGVDDDAASRLAERRAIGEEVLAREGLREPGEGPS
jgi:hypothetical protein